MPLSKSPKAIAFWYDIVLRLDRTAALNAGPAFLSRKRASIADENRIGLKGVALQHATEVHRNDVFQAGRASSGLPVEDHIE